MKRFFILVAIIFISILSWAQSITLSVDKINSNELKVGDTVVLSLNVNEYQQPISAFQVFLEFDQTVLTYIMTQNVNKLFEAQWQENSTKNIYTGLYLSGRLEGFNINDDEQICQLLFEYKGGQTDLMWGRVDEDKDGFKVKGRTTFLNLQNKDIDLVLVDGCVCKQ